LPFVQNDKLKIPVNTITLKIKPYTGFILVAGLLMGLAMLLVSRIPWGFGAGVSLLSVLVILKMSEVTIGPEKIVQKFLITNVRREFLAGDLSAIPFKDYTDHEGKRLLSIIIYDQRDRKIVLSSRIFNEADIIVALTVLRNHYEKKFLEY
jgi:hypothetical protein